jgi:hypothetical protein
MAVLRNRRPPRMHPGCADPLLKSYSLPPWARFPDLFVFVWNWVTRGHITPSTSPPPLTPPHRAVPPPRLLPAENLPYKFKNSYGDLRNRNFEKLHRTTGPRSDLRPDSWFWANSGLETTSRIFESEFSGVATRASQAKAQYSCMTQSWCIS